MNTSKYRVMESNGYRTWVVGEYSTLREARAAARVGVSGHSCTIYRRRPSDEAAGRKGTWQVWEG